MPQASNTSNTSFISIPGNIKQEYLPFVLSKDNAINNHYGKSPLVAGNPQIFSFRHSTSAKASEKTPVGILNICPSSFDSVNISKDISFAACFGKDSGTSPITLQNIFDNIPGIQIREFQPDTMLDQFMTLIKDLYGAITKKWVKKDDDLSASNNAAPKVLPKADSGQFFSAVHDAAKWSIKYITGQTGENIYTDNPMITDGQGIYKGGDELAHKYIMNFPYMLYYKFQSCTTTNLYELPCVVDGNRLYQSDSAGFGDETFELMSLIPGGSGLANANNFIGKAVKTLLGNVRINFMPFWHAGDGYKTAEPEVVVKFDLFNDTAQAATINFIFVNTIVPGNKWIQYNVFQHSPCLYDIKLEGYNRLFCCQANYNVQYAGVLREPSKQWISDLISKYANNKIKETLTAQYVIDNHLIKIPDIYKVEMHFSSLLPANFNNYLYTWSTNTNIIETYKVKPVYEKSAVGEFITNGITKFNERLDKYWPSKFPTT